MGKFFDHIPANIVPWIQSQKIFWVATAPLAEDGHVNVSPKGYADTMNIVFDDADDNSNSAASGAAESDSPGNDDDVKNGLTSRSVWYEDLTGSGVETISHLRENGRITIMFSAFEGPPQIVRLFGTGKVFEFGTPEYEALLPDGKRQPGSRAVIWVDVHKVGTSCGFSIPFFAYKSPRNKLRSMAAHLEQMEYEHACKHSGSSSSSPSEPNLKSGSTADEEVMGLKKFWKGWNMKGIDGLPGLEVAYGTSKVLGDWRTKGIEWGTDDESIPAQQPAGERSGKGKALAIFSTGGPSDIGKVLFGVGLGVVLSTVVTRVFK